MGVDVGCDGHVRVTKPLAAHYDVLPSLQSDARMEVTQAADGHLGVTDTSAKLLDGAGELHGVDPATYGVGEYTSLITIRASQDCNVLLLLGPVLRKHLCCAAVQVNPTATALSLRRLQDKALLPAADQRAFYNQVADVQVNAGP